VSVTVGAIVGGAAGLGGGTTTVGDVTVCMIVFTVTPALLVHDTRPVYVPAAVGANGILPLIAIEYIEYAPPFVEISKTQLFAPVDDQSTVNGVFTDVVVCEGF
jgi:hypothetical protein